VQLNLEEHLQEYIAYVLFVSWVVGIGRYWDHPSAHPLQYIGLGSVLYIGILALILKWIIEPLAPERCSYRVVFVFVGMTSLPAMLYAIPVERFMSLENAQLANVWFLAVVATWRVLLLWRFLSRAMRLTGLAIIVALLLPLSGIVASLALFNLEHVVFDIMSGLRPEQQSGNDDAYSVVVVMSILATVTFPFTLLTYWILLRLRKRQQH